jgi:hypothetical protein
MINCQFLKHVLDMQITTKTKSNYDFNAYNFLFLIVIIIRSIQWLYQNTTPQRHSIQGAMYGASPLPSHATPFCATLQLLSLFVFNVLIYFHAAPKE